MIRYLENDTQYHKSIQNIYLWCKTHPKHQNPFPEIKLFQKSIFSNISFFESACSAYFNGPPLAGLTLADLYLDMHRFICLYIYISIYNQPLVLFNVKYSRIRPAEVALIRDGSRVLAPERSDSSGALASSDPRCEK